MEQKLDVLSWNRFITRNFRIEPTLIGKKHVFRFLDADVTISVPKKSEVNRPDNFDQIATCTSYWVRDEGDIPSKYDIHKVDVLVDLSESVAVDSNILNRKCNAFDLVSPSGQEKLNQLCSVHYDIATKAFEYWVSVLRWSADNHKIGRHEVQKNDSGWTTYLKEKATNTKVWAGTTVINFGASKTLTKSEWNMASKRLRNGLIPPAHLTILHEAQEYLDRGEYRRALIDLAVCSEIYIRTTITERLPSSLDPYILGKVEKYGITECANNLFPNILSENGRKKFVSVRPNLDALFKARNRVMHMADHNIANEHKCNIFLKAVRELFELEGDLSKIATTNKKAAI